MTCRLPRAQTRGLIETERDMHIDTSASFRGPKPAASLSQHADGPPIPSASRRLSPWRPSKLSGGGAPVAPAWQATLPLLFLAPPCALQFLPR